MNAGENPQAFPYQSRAAFTSTTIVTIQIRMMVMPSKQDDDGEEEKKNL